MRKNIENKLEKRLNNIEKELLNLTIEDRLNNFASVIVDRIIEDQQKGISHNYE
jgi:hypothetical protein